MNDAQGITTTAARKEQRALPSAESRDRLRRWRGFKDGTSKYVVGIGGVSVIVSLGLIFVYLFSEVAPLLRPASLDKVAEYDVPGSEARTIYLAMDRFREVGFRAAADGTATFFRPSSGEVLEEVAFGIPEDVEVTSHGSGEPRTRLTVLGLSDGTGIAFRAKYEDIFEAGERRVGFGVDYPFGDEPIVIDDRGSAITNVAIQEGGRGIVIAAATEDGRLLLVQYEATTNFMTGETTLARRGFELPHTDFDITRMMLSIDLRDLLIGDTEGNLHYYDVSRPAQARLVDSRSVVSSEAVTALNYLLGTVSIIVGGADGSVVQWFLVRDDRNVRRITRVRAFDSHPAPVTDISPEYARKGFVTTDTAGNLALH